jgi:hypothetical protein
MDTPIKEFEITPQISKTRLLLYTPSSTRVGATKYSAHKTKRYNTFNNTMISSFDTSGPSIAKLQDKAAPKSFDLGTGSEQQGDISSFSINQSAALRRTATKTIFNSKEKDMDLPSTRDRIKERDEFSLLDVLSAKT